MNATLLRRVEAALECLGMGKYGNLLADVRAAIKESEAVQVNAGKSGEIPDLEDRKDRVCQPAPSSDTLTPELIAELRGLMEKATKGPVIAVGAAMYEVDPYGPISCYGDDGDTFVSKQQLADTALDVALRNAAPALLAAAEREAKLRVALVKLANNELSDANCASVYIAGERVRIIARAALAQGE